MVVPPGHERIRTARTYRHVELVGSRIVIGLSGGTVNRVYRQAINLRSFVDVSRTIYAAKRSASSPLNISCLVHTAHMIRAILFASATVALLWPTLACVFTAQVSNRVSCLPFAALRRAAINAARAPCISIVRR